MATTAQINAAVTQFVNDSNVAHQIVHGGINLTVGTDGGSVDSFAKLINDLRNDFESGMGGIFDTVVGGYAAAAQASATSANNSAIAASASAVSAIDAAASIGDSVVQAENAADTATAKATAASGSATSASSAADTAAVSATTAQTAATNAASYLSTVQTHASEAQVAASSAQLAASNAQTAATTATTAVANIDSSVTSAAASANTATTKAGEAAASATSAAGSASSASTSATSASTSETNAAASAASILSMSVTPDPATLSNATLDGTEYVPIKGTSFLRTTISSIKTFVLAGVDATIRGTSLTGLSTATSVVISAADTVLSALGKLQAQLFGIPIAVNTISALRAISSSTFSKATVAGYYSKGDGGGGSYWYDATDTTSTDNGGSIIVAADNARWKLIVQKEVSVRQFGAKLDGTTDDKTAAQNAINSGYPVYIPHTPTGMLISAALTCPAGTRVRGQWKKTTVILGTAGEFCFHITGNNVMIEGLVCDCSIGTGGGVFKLRTDLSSLNYIFIRDIVSLSATSFIEDVTHASNVGVTWQIQRCQARTHRGAGVKFTQAFAYLLLEDVTIDYVGSSSRNFTGFSLTGNQGSFLNRCDVTGGLVDATTTSNHAFAFSNSIAVWLSNCMADTIGGNGFYVVGNCYAMYFTACVSSLCGKIGFAIGSTGGTSYDITFANCAQFGRKGQTYAPAFAGWQFDVTNKIQMSGCFGKNNTGDGLMINASTRMNISGGRFDNNLAYGINSFGTVSGVIVGAAFDSNTSGNVNLTSSNIYVASSQAHSGSLINLAGPGSA